MGFAIIGIFLCHYAYLTNISKIFNLGSMGVEIFFFLSGMGLVMSWQKDPSTIHFYKKRVLRIFPSYYIATIYIILLGFVWHPSGIDIYSRLFFMDENLWFISYLLVFYSIFPLYMLLSKKINPYLIFCIIVACTLLMMGSLWLFYPDYSGSFLDMKIGRTPSFFLGCLAAQKPKLCNNRVFWKVFAILALISLFICCRTNERTLKDIGVVWQLRTCMIPGFCFALISICSIIKKMHLLFLITFISFLGGITLEIYLTESYFSSSIRDCISLAAQPLGWIFCILSAFIIHLLSKKLNKWPAYLLARFSFSARK